MTLGLSDDEQTEGEGGLFRAGPWVIPGRFAGRVASLLGLADPAFPTGGSTIGELVVDQLVVNAALGSGKLPLQLIKTCHGLSLPGPVPARVLGVCLVALFHPKPIDALTSGGALTARLEQMVDLLEMDRLDGIVREMVGGEGLSVVLRQISRVAMWVIGDDERRHVQDGAMLVAAFRRRGLMPPVLLRSLSDSPILGFANLEGRALAFTACCYPERAFQMDPVTELPARIQAFNELIVSLSGKSAVGSAVSIAIWSLRRSGLQPAEWEDASRIHDLLADLSAADIVDDAWLGGTGAEDRRTGAALFLGTFTKERLETLTANWSREHRFLRDLRSRICISPLSLLSSGKSHRRGLGWDEVRDVAERVWEGMPAEHIDHAIVLTQMAWNKISDLRLERPVDRVGGFWDFQMARLSSGFPYFAFLSRFVWWWKLCLRTHPFPRDDERMPGDDTVPAEVEEGMDASGDRLLGAGVLRSLLEGYRLVRTTFFRRSDAAEEGELSGTSTEGTELVRKALDALWYERLQRPDEEEGEPQMLRELALRFAPIGLLAITDYSHRLPIRMQAYVLARHQGLSNEAIRRLTRTRRTASKGWIEYRPYEKEPGCLPITSLVRAIPSQRTLFWAFLAHITLYPKVFPQRPDPWDLERLVREVRWWMTPVQPSPPESGPCVTEDGAVGGQGSGGPSPASKHAGEPLSGECPAGIQELVGTLRESEVVRRAGNALITLHSPEDLEAWNPAEGWEPLRGVVQAFLERIPGCPGRIFDRAEMARLRKGFDRELHWLVPVWYHTFIETFPAGDFGERLSRDASEALALQRRRALLVRLGGGA